MAKNNPLPDHFRLSPSSSSRWLCCPGSAVDDLPDTKNNASMAGDIGHARAEFYLREGDDDLLMLADEVYNLCLPLLDEEAASAVADSAVAYVEYIQQILADNLACKLSVENKLTHPWIADLGGTIDAMITTDEKLTIVDLKTGKWKVSAKNNTQLKCYALLAMHAQFWVYEEVTCVIVQPRAFAKPQVVTFTADELKDFENLIDEAGKSDERIPGNHCYFCPLKEDCDEYRG